MAFVWQPKDPDEVLDYTHDWSLRLGDLDTITGTPVAIVEEGTVTVDGSSASGDIQTVCLSGGTHDEIVKITLRIETVMGRTYDEGIKMRVRHR